MHQQQFRLDISSSVHAVTQQPREQVQTEKSSSQKQRFPKFFP